MSQCISVTFSIYINLYVTMSFPNTHTQFQCCGFQGASNYTVTKDANFDNCMSYEVVTTSPDGSTLPPSHPDCLQAFQDWGQNGVHIWASVFVAVVISQVKSRICFLFFWCVFFLIIFCFVFCFSCFSLFLMFVYFFFFFPF